MASMPLTWALSLTVLSSFFTDTSTTTVTDREFLYISDQQIYELPSFDEATTCTVPPHPVPGLYESVAGMSNNSLVICGGDRDRDRCHTLTTTGWDQTASLVTGVDSAAASQSPYGLMVTGGNDGSGAQSTTQIYSDGRWTLGPSLPEPRFWHCQVYVGETVFIAGGWPGISGTSYALEEGNWRQVATMRTPVFGGHACTVYDGEVYALGSWSGTTEVQIYNFATNSWRYGPSLPSPVSFPQAFVYGDRVTVTSGDGAVYQLVGSDWDTVGQIQGYSSRHVFPAPVVTSQILKCGA